MVLLDSMVSLDETAIPVDKEMQHMESLVNLALEERTVMQG